MFFKTYRLRILEIVCRRQLSGALLFGALFLFSCAANAGLLNNGNFSAGGLGWNHWNGDVRSEFDGSGQLATKAWAFDNNSNAGGAFQDVPGIAGQEYTISADIAIDSVEPLPVNGGKALTKLEFYDAGGAIINGPYGTDISVIVNNGTTTPIGEWIHVTGSMVSPPETATVRVVVMALYTGGGVAVAWFDNVSLTGPTVPATNDPDYNDDGDVDFVDFSDLAGAWNQVSGTYNLAGEELIDMEDLEVFASAWLRTSPYPGYALAWSDEFNGSSINTSTWNWEIGDSGWGNNEWQYYTNHPDNSYIDNGNLVIVAREDHLGHNYTSARMTTQNKQSFMYGCLEARIKLPTGQGIWPAFWMMPAESVYGGWASSGEIDIMEMINQATTVYGTLHFGGGWPNNQSTGGSYSPGGVDFSEDFHVYMLEWEPDVMRWYVDGVLFSTKTNNQWWSDAAPGNPRAPFDQPFFFILNVAVGGNWPGYPDASTSFPQSMYIDYVRVYQLTQ